MASDDRPTPRQIRRPLPGIPHDPRREPDTPYPPPRIERRDTLRAPTMPQEAPGQPSVSPAADAALGRLVRHGLAKALPYLLTMLGGAGSGGYAVERTLRPELDASKELIADQSKRIDLTRKELADLESRRALERKAIACQLRVLASAAKRQGYDPDFESEARWRSEYLEDPRKVRTTPVWRAAERCPEVP